MSEQVLTITVNRKRADLDWPALFTAQCSIRLFRKLNRGLSEVLQKLCQFKRRLTRTCSGCLVAFLALSFRILLESLDFRIDFFNKFFHIV